MSTEEAFERAMQRLREAQAENNDLRSRLDSETQLVKKWVEAYRKQGEELDQTMRERDDARGAGREMERRALNAESRLDSTRQELTDIFKMFERVGAWSPMTGKIMNRVETLLKTLVVDQPRNLTAAEQAGMRRALLKSVTLDGCDICGGAHSNDEHMANCDSEGRYCPPVVERQEKIS